MDQQLERRIQYLISDKVNFISGTMCPVDKNTAGTVLEDIEQGLNYYRENGVEDVVITEKKMGNRQQCFITPDITKCFSISRNGFKIKIDLTKQYQILIDQFQNEFNNGLEARILDCELMPWRVLGEDLIDRSFYGFYELAQKEEEFCNQNNFTEALNKSTLKINTVSLAELEEFKAQIDIYGKMSNTEIWPFSILKDIYIDGSEKIYNNSDNYEIFKQINNDHCFLISSLDIESAKLIQRKLVEKNKAEGIVIKPQYNKEGVAPYLKCRNEKYLKLIYGPDYQQSDKFQRLISRKRIKYKLRESIREYEIGIQMLKVPFHEIGSSEYKDLCFKFLTGQRLDLDPRL